jgi:hypothetical protein
MAGFHRYPMERLLCYLPFDRHPTCLGSDRDDIEYLVLDPCMQLGPHPIATRASFLRQIKALYQRLLPDMQVDHIRSTVYDSSNVSTILVKNQTDVIGGATYSPWDDWGYAEVVW